MDGRSEGTKNWGKEEMQFKLFFCGKKSPKEIIYSLLIFCCLLVCELQVRESNYSAPIYTKYLFWRASTAFPPSGNEAKSPGWFENKGRSGAILDLTGKCSILDRCFLSVFLCYFILNKPFNKHYFFTLFYVFYVSTRRNKKNPSIKR